MEQGFIDAVQKMVKDNGKDTLLETRKAKAMLGDFTQNNFPKETNLLKQLLDANCANIINKARDVAEVKTALVKRLEDDHHIAPKGSAEMLDVLGLVLRGDKSKTAVSGLAQPAHNKTTVPQETSNKQTELERLKAELAKAKEEEETEKLKAELEKTRASTARLKAEKEKTAAYAASAPASKSAPPPGVSADALSNQGVAAAKAGDLAKAKELYQWAADMGEQYAQYNLGNCYYYGSGVAKDHAQSAYWFRKAAEQGNAYAQNSLGYAYYKGEGIAQDYAQAVYWYRKAAEQNNKDGEYNLGIAYEHGNGVAKDITQAIELYCYAAARGHDGAQKSLDRLKAQGHTIHLQFVDW